MRRFPHRRFLKVWGGQFSEMPTNRQVDERDGKCCAASGESGSMVFQSLANIKAIPTLEPLAVVVHVAILR